MLKGKKHPKGTVLKTLSNGLQFISGEKYTRKGWNPSRTFEAGFLLNGGQTLYGFTEDVRLDRLRFYEPNDTISDTDYHASSPDDWSKYDYELVKDLVELSEVEKAFLSAEEKTRPIGEPLQVNEESYQFIVGTKYLHYKWNYDKYFIPMYIENGHVIGLTENGTTRRFVGGKYDWKKY